MADKKISMVVPAQLLKRTSQVAMSGEVRPLTAQQRAVAERELGETEASKEDALGKLRAWLRDRPHLAGRADDQWLLTFLRGCKFSVDRASRKLQAYSTLRPTAPEFFAGRSPFEPKIQALLDAGVLSYLQQTDRHGCRVAVVRLNRMDPGGCSATDMFRLSLMCSDMLLRDDAAVVCGCVSVVDMAGFTLQHAAMFSISGVRKFLTIFQEAYPLRVKAIHFVNTPTFFETFANIFLFFMKKKLRQRVVVHSSTKTLLQHLDRDSLPEELGGTGVSCKQLAAEWKRRMEQEADLFREEGSTAAASAPFAPQKSILELEVD